eukprot:scaffold404349_cov28-Attheya_sp.AAC.1
MHMQRSNGAITDCGAKACYDGILAIIAALTNYKAGLPEHMCTFFAKALKQMRYHMVTAYGVSDEANQHTNEDPIHGLGQGSTDGPTGWNQVSNVMIKVHNKQANGSTIQDPTRSIK